MVNELVKYDTELNTIPLRKFKPVEMNLFFSIVSRMRDKGTSTVRFSFNQLKELSNYKPTANKRFEDDIQKTYEKMMSLRFGRRSNSGLTREFFVLFSEFKIDGDTDDPYVEVEVYKKAVPLLNNLERWVRFNLPEFNKIKSSYSKTMFRLLKQFRTTGYASFSEKDFRELLDIPKSYKSFHISQRVLQPIKEELAPLFKGLTIRKKYGKGRGKPVIGYVFTWKAERKDEEDVHVSKQQRLEKQIFNVEHNADLSKKEKWRAIDKVKEQPIGTTEKEKLEAEQKKHDKKIADRTRAEVLAELRLKNKVNK